jgi:monoamine oxidase
MVKDKKVMLATSTPLPLPLPLALPLPLEYRVSQWCRDPFSLGGWSSLRPCASDDTRRILQEPFGPRIFLCGEHTHPTQAAMVHGAYQEGIRAANAVLAENPKPKTVLIVGAGAAGLGCAWQLLQHNDNDNANDIQVTVLEARDRIGGRVRTVEMMGDTKSLRVELGANWLQQGDHNSLYPIAKTTLNLETVDTDFMRPDEYPLHRYVPPERVDQIMKEFAERSNHQTGRYKLSTDLDQPQSQQPQPQPQSIQDVLDDWFREIEIEIEIDTSSSTTSTSTSFTREEIQHVLEGELMIDTGVELSQLSSRFGMEPGVGQGDRWLVGGYRQVLDYLATNVDIQFQWAVQRIDSSAEDRHPHQLRVTAQRQQQHGHDNKDPEKIITQTWAVDAVVCAIPSAVLQRKPPLVGAIDFVPPMPQHHRDAIDALVTGQVEKVVLRFEQRWWPPATQSNGYLRVYGDNFGDVSEWLDCTDTFGVPVITGIFTGPWLNDIWSEGSTDQEIALKATAALYHAIHHNTGQSPRSG